MEEKTSKNTFTKELVLVICGPTASGKSSLAINLAQKLKGSKIAAHGAEIVSADSMQIYKKLDIGTAKVNEKEKMLVKHHMIDICEPTENYSVARYKKEATAIIRQILAQGRLPIVCGGTGQYLKALIEGINYREDTVDEKVRAELNDYADRYGTNKLLIQLEEKDPAAASKLSAADRKRIIRAHEIIVTTGLTPTQVNEQSKLKGPDFKFIPFCLAPERQLLYERINQRTYEMIANGWIEETKDLLKSGIPAQATALQAIGYKQIQLFLEGKYQKQELIEIIQRNTRRYAKRQLTWFRSMPELIWLHYKQRDSQMEIVKQIIDMLIKVIKY